MAHEIEKMQVKSLDHECQVLTRYLIGKDPSEYVKGKYWEAHGTASGLENVPAGRFDRLLLRIAIMHEFLAQMTDSYARILFKTASIRKKCVLLAAILECSPRMHEAFEALDGKGKIVFWAEIAARGIGFTLVACLAVIVFWPFHVLLEDGGP